MPSLRDYQLDLKDRVLNAPGHVLCVMPTGGGKSVFLANLVSERDHPCAVIAHRREIISQLSLHLASWGVRHRIIASRPVVRLITNQHRKQFGTSFYAPTASVGVASIQTLASKTFAARDWAQQCRTVVLDEAHHYLRQNRFGETCTMFPHAQFLGMTATPRRADNKALGAQADGLFDTMVCGPTTGRLIADGWLTDYKYIAAGDIDLSGVAITKTGDYSPTGLKAALSKSEIVGDIVTEYQRHAAGRQGITFGADVESAQHIAEQYRNAGIAAECIHAKTDDALRNALIDKFRVGDVTQLVNVDLFGEGFDVPGVEVVSMARPTQSLALFLQQCGRSLRVAPGKERAIIIDHVSNWKRHGLPDSPREWSLDANPRRRNSASDGGPKLRVCVECTQPHPAHLSACPWCSAERPAPVARQTIDQVEGNLTELDARVLMALRETVRLETPESMADRVGYVAGAPAGIAAFRRQTERIETQHKLAEAIDLWAGAQRDAGLRIEEMYRLFYSTFGVDVLSAQNRKSREMAELQSHIERDIIATCSASRTQNRKDSNHEN